MKYLKLHENFDFNDDDFDFDEEDENTFNFDKYTTVWKYAAGYGNTRFKSIKVEKNQIEEFIKLIEDNDFVSHGQHSYKGYGNHKDHYFILWDVLMDGTKQNGKKSYFHYDYNPSTQKPIQYIKEHKDFEWAEDDFDFDEEQPYEELKIGDEFVIDTELLYKELPSWTDYFLRKKDRVYTVKYIENNFKYDKYVTVQTDYYLPIKYCTKVMNENLTLVMTTLISKRKMIHLESKIV